MAFVVDLFMLLGSVHEFPASVYTIALVLYAEQLFLGSVYRVV